MSSSPQPPAELSDAALLVISGHVFRSIHVSRQAHLALVRGLSAWRGFVRRRDGVLSPSC